MVELIVVIGVVALTVPVVFSLFFSVLRARSKIYILQEIKKSGDHSLNIMTNLIRQSAVAIYSDQSLTTEVCSTKSKLDTSSSFNGSLYFKDQFGDSFYFEKINDRIVYSYITTNPLIAANKVDLMTVHTKLDNDGLTTTCYRTNPFSLPIVSVKFIILQASGTTQEEKASLSYAANIKLRN